MEITREWIDAHRTARGGWTKAQLAAIGVAWPPKSGWKRDVIGKSVTSDARRAFERAAK